MQNYFDKFFIKVLVITLVSWVGLTAPNVAIGTAVETEFDASVFEPIDLNEQHDSLDILNNSADDLTTPNSHQANVSINTFESEQHPKIKSNSDKMESVITSMNYKLQSNEDAHLYLDKQLTKIESTQKTIVESLQKILKTNFDDFESKLTDLGTNMTALVEEIGNIDARTRHAESRGPPFRLVAIDAWQSSWTAVLVLSGRITMLEPGETRAGWRLIQVDPLARTALFRHDVSKQEASLEVSE